MVCWGRGKVVVTGLVGEQERKDFFSRELLTWYGREGRDLPWRRSRDPYHIWVSEIMLQQTRVDTVIPYFYRFIDRFPTLAALAEAPEEEVLKHWEGLGYYSRARNLQTAVREVVAEYGARVPDNKEAVSGLKGVGPYTTGAILSIAYNKPEPAVDGNVMRVLSRYLLIEDDIAKPAVRVLFEEQVRTLIPEGRASDFNQALMDFGATVCTPKKPGCLVCPVSVHCAGRLAGRESELPVKSRAKPPKPVYRLAALVAGTGERAGKVLVRQRNATGLLASMWELPQLEAPGEELWQSVPLGGAWLAEELLAQQSLPLRLASPVAHIADAQHVFTHLVWHVRVIGATADCDEAALEQLGYRWVGPAEFERYVWPNVFRKLLIEYFESMH